MAIKVTDSNGNTVKVAGRGVPGVPGQKGVDGKSAYDYAVAGGYKGSEAEFQALMGSGPWVPGRRADLDGKLNAKVAQTFRMTVPQKWCKFGEIYASTFYLYTMITNIAANNPMVPNIAFFGIGGNLAPTSMRVNGKLIYLMYTPYYLGRIVVGRDRGLYAMGGLYSFIDYNSVRADNVAIYSAPVEVNAAPTDILWDSSTASDFVALSSQLAAAVQEGLSL